MNNNQEKEVYGEYLKSAVSSYMNGVQTMCLLTDYEIRCNKMAPKRAFAELLESYGNENTQKACDLIAAEILKRGRDYKTEHDPKKRVYNAAKKLSQNVSKLSVEVNGHDFTEQARDMAQPHVPEIFQTSFLEVKEFKPKQHECMAEFKGKPMKIEFEVV